ncbi:MAG: ATP-binding protein [Cyanobacteria bacterium P01_D01_bin.56]
MLKYLRPLVFFKEARTKIFVLYVAFMLAAVGAAMPIYRALLFSVVDARVNENLAEEIQKFRDVYAGWRDSNDPSLETLSDMLDGFISNTLPQDDNFIIAILDGNIYRSTPVSLPEAINAGSPLFQRWVQTQEISQEEYDTGDPGAGTVIYGLKPLKVNGELRGQMVISHLSAGERKDALDSLYVFAKVASGLLVIALGVAWFATGRVLQPVRDLAKTARSINETDLGGRLEVSGTGELAELAKTFNSMMDRLQGAFNSQRNFIDDAGHELRTPITIIQGHLELIGDDPVEQAETVDLVLDEMDRMARLVNDLILIVKSEHPNFLHLETIDVPRFCSDLFAKAQTLADRDWQLTIETKVKVVADPQRLTGALLNLLNNASQHTQINDSIELGCRHENNHVAFWVRDTGEGIPLAEQTRVFERFARVQNTQRKSDGAGLGLAIVRAIAEAHGGKIDMSSQSGVGSVFSLYLPLEQSVELPSS